MDGKIKKTVLAAVLFFLSVLIYLNTLSNGFVYDDSLQIVKNPWIRDASYIPDIFSSSLGAFLPNVTTATYRPMVHMVYMLEYSLFGLNPAPWHLVNIILNAVAVLMVFAAAARVMKGRGGSILYPFAAALYFAVHPVHSEAVSWLGTMQEMSYTILLLAAFLIHSSEDVSYGKAGVSALVFFAALLFKETAIIYPLLAFAYDSSIRKKRGAPQWASYAAYAGAAFVYFLLRTNAVKTALPGINWFHLTPYQYVINVFPLLPLYFYKLVLPVNLNAYYYIEPAMTALTLKTVLSISFAALMLYVLYRLYRYDRILFFSLAWVPLSFLPALYLPGVGKNFFAERYLYLPSAGFAVFAAAAAEKIIERYAGAAQRKKTLLICIAGAALLLLIAQTVGRNRVWRDDYTLWTDTVRKSPEAALPHYNLGVEYAGRGENGLAIRQFYEAVRIDPDYEDAHFNLAAMYDRSGVVKEAVDHYREVLRINRRAADAHLNLGVLYRKEGRLTEAADEFRTALAIDKNLSAAKAYLDELGAGNGAKGR